MVILLDVFLWITPVWKTLFIGTCKYAANYTWIILYSFVWLLHQRRHIIYGRTINMTFAGKIKLALINIQMKQQHPFFTGSKQRVSQDYVKINFIWHLCSLNFPSQNLIAVCVYCTGMCILYNLVFSHVDIKHCWQVIQSKLLKLLKIIAQKNGSV